jgi:hypothetical protein
LAVRGQSAPALNVSVGDAAKAAESEKFCLYRKRFKIDDHIAPFGVEATGALGPSAKALLWRVARNDDAAPDIRSARYRHLPALRRPEGVRLHNVQALPDEVRGLPEAPG